MTTETKSKPITIRGVEPEVWRKLRLVALVENKLAGKLLNEIIAAYLEGKLKVRG